MPCSSCAADAVQTHCHSSTAAAHAAAQISHSVTLNYMCGTPQPNHTPGFDGQSPASAEQLDTQRSSPLYSTGAHLRATTWLCKAAIAALTLVSAGAVYSNCSALLNAHVQIRPPDTPQAPSYHAIRHMQCMNARLVLALHLHSTAPGDLTASFHSNSKPLGTKAAIGGGPPMPKPSCLPCPQNPPG